MIGEVVVNIGKARPKVIVASMALPKKPFAPRAAIFLDTHKKPEIYISNNFLELILTFSEALYLDFGGNLIIILCIVYMSVCYLFTFWTFV